MYEFLQQVDTLAVELLQGRAASSTDATVMFKFEGDVYELPRLQAQMIEQNLSLVRGALAEMFVMQSETATYSVL